MHVGISPYDGSNLSEPLVFKYFSLLLLCIRPLRPICLHTGQFKMPLLALSIVPSSKACVMMVAAELIQMAAAASGLQRTKQFWTCASEFTAVCRSDSCHSKACQLVMRCDEVCVMRCDEDTGIIFRAVNRMTMTDN
jgi:hypothetical protein